MKQSINTNRVLTSGLIGACSKKLFWGVVGLSGIASEAYSQAEKPNIVLILIDDLGYSAMQCYGNKLVPTPNIDRIAQNGVRFTQAYACPQSTPTRASLLTGQYTANNKMWHVIPKYGCPYARMSEPDYLDNLPREQFTVAEALQRAGYTTACVGKWHLSTYPNDGYYTYLYADKAHFYGFDYVTPIQNPTEYHATGDKGVNFLTDDAIQFVEKNQKKPFFLYLSHHTIHGKVLAPKELELKYLEEGYPAEGLNSATYLAALKHLDNSVGRFMNKLTELGLDKNTVVIYMSDNGGVDQEFDNAPLRYGKGTVYEGGTRVPFMIQWPGKVQAGIISKSPVHAIDIYPTLLEIAHAPKPAEQKLDGVSLLPLITGDKKSELNAAKRFFKRPVFMYAPLYDLLWGATPAASMVLGDYKVIWFFGDYIDLEQNGKYITQGRVELYNLTKDIGEKQDLSLLLPSKTKAMAGMLKKWILSTGCEIPGLNPNFDINKWSKRVDYKE